MSFHYEPSPHNEAHSSTSVNGVAERAIRSIMEVVRAKKEASGCPVGFWPHLVEHAVDVLNRTTGQPQVDSATDTADMCAYEFLRCTGKKSLRIRASRRAARIRNAHTTCTRSLEHVLGIPTRVMCRKRSSSKSW